MPNQRAPGIVLLSVPVHKTLKRDIKKLARSNGKSLAEFVRDNLLLLASKAKSTGAL